MIKNYIPALITALVWGSTFVASKHVLDAGVTPLTLMTMRFGLAYLILLLFCRQRMRFEWNTTELKLFIIAISGGSLYFLLEYMALKYTSAVNVGLICATVPVISEAIDLCLRGKIPRTCFLIGSAIAFAGVTLLVTRGNLLIDIFPTGDILAIGSAILWSIYTVVLSRVGRDIPEIVVERRMMFYSFVTILPVAALFFDTSELSIPVSQPDVLLSAIYLGVIASAGCMWLWNVSINRIGIVRTNNFLYLLPVVSFITSVVFAGEEICLVTTIAMLLIVLGIVIADR